MLLKSSKSVVLPTKIHVAAGGAGAVDGAVELQGPRGAARQADPRGQGIVALRDDDGA